VRLRMIDETSALSMVGLAGRALVESTSYRSTAVARDRPEAFTDPTFAAPVLTKRLLKRLLRVR
jgi:hypothetical protein